MKVAAVLGGVAAYGVALTLATQGIAQQIEERYQYERTHTETTTHTPAAPPAVAPPVVIEKQAPPVVIEKQTTNTVPVPMPQALKEGQQVSLTGKVVEVDPGDDELVLEFNGQRVLVDTDDLSTNPMKEGPMLRPGDQITVHGKVEDINHSRVKVTAASIDVLGRNQALQTVR